MFLLKQDIWNNKFLWYQVATEQEVHNYKVSLTNLHVRSSSAITMAYLRFLATVLMGHGIGSEVL